MRHWAAFRLDQTIPFCRAGMPDESLPEGDETTLSDERCDCCDCRRILQMGPLPPGDNSIECPNCTPHDREDCPDDSMH